MPDTVEITIDVPVRIQSAYLATLEGRSKTETRESLNNDETLAYFSLLMLRLASVHSGLSGEERRCISDGLISAFIETLVERLSEQMIWGT